MGLAQTAQLLVELNLGGNFTSGIGQAESRLGAFGATAGTSIGKAGILSGAFASVGTAAGRVGGALSHAGSQVKNLVTGPLGMIGLAGGLFTFAGALEKGISKAQEWGLAIEKLTGVTGDSAETLSGLLAVTDKYGISSDRLVKAAAFSEKALGNLGTTTKKLATFQADFGFSLVDAQGKILDFNTLLLKFSDYYNGNATASQKAAAAAKLFGRGYVDLIPVLKLGSKGILDAEAAAAALGLTLNKTNVVDLASMRDNTRKLGEAIGGLELQIGLALIPAINDLATSAANFISSNRTDIVAFFKNVVTVGKTVIGIIGQVAGTLGNAWNAIPGPLRDFLIKGLVADRTIKFLFGFSPLGALVSGIEGALGKAVGNGLVAAGLGKLFVQPVFVTNPGFGAGGGLPNIAGAASGAAGGLGAALTIGLSLITVAGIAEAIREAIALHDAGPAAAQRQFEQNPLPQFGNRSRGNPTFVSLATTNDRLETIHQAILAQGGPIVAARAAAKQDKINASLETLRQQMLAKQSAANSKLGQIAAAAGKNHITVPIRIAIDARHSGVYTQTVNTYTQGTTGVGGSGHTPGGA